MLTQCRGNLHYAHHIVNIMYHAVSYMLTQCMGNLRYAHYNVNIMFHMGSYMLTQCMENWRYVPKGNTSSVHRINVKLSAYSESNQN